MSKKITVYTLYALLLSGLIFGLAQAASNIDATHKWAWGENIGWLNFNTTDGGVTVYDDHLEGYVWAENIGWIRLGTHTDGGSHTYTNASASDYGVNKDASGNLTGYGWSENAGWINFDPAGAEQVTIDTAGDFSGYGWSENLGWVKLAGATYQVSMTVSEASFQSYLPILVRH